MRETTGLFPTRIIHVRRDLFTERILPARKASNTHPAELGRGAMPHVEYIAKERAAARVAAGC